MHKIQLVGCCSYLTRSEMNNIILITSLLQHQLQLCCCLLRLIIIRELITKTETILMFLSYLQQHLEQLGPRKNQFSKNKTEYL